MNSVKKSLNRLPLAPVVAAMFAAVAAVLVIAMPHWLFEYYVQRVGLPGLLPAATPPLGNTARIGAAVAAFGATGAALWALLATVERRWSEASDSLSDYPSVTAGPPEPLRAEAELGAPLMSEEAITQAREELLLDAPMVEEEAQPVVDAEVIEPEPISGPEIIEVMPPAPPAAAISRLPVAPESLAGLVRRLDAALLDKPVGWKPKQARAAAR
jgi:hypothetical protein